MSKIFFEMFAFRCHNFAGKFQHKIVDCFRHAFEFLFQLRLKNLKVFLACVYCVTLNSILNIAPRMVTNRDKEAKRDQKNKSTFLTIFVEVTQTPIFNNKNFISEYRNSIFSN